MSDYQLEPLRGKALRYFRKAPPNRKSDIQKAIKNILESPKKHTSKKSAQKHMKRGEFFCKWENKEKKGLRIVYSIDKEKKMIKIYYIETHIDRQR